MSDTAIQGMTIAHVGTKPKQSLGRFLQRWMRQRKNPDLTRFSDRELVDIGLRRADVRSVLDRPFFAP